MPGDEIFRKDPGGAYEGNQQNHKDQHGDHENPEGADDRTGGKEQCLKMYKGKKKSIREPIVEIEFISFRKN